MVKVKPLSKRKFIRKDNINLIENRVEKRVKSFKNSQELSELRRF
jgi:hypothetical protein